MTESPQKWGEDMDGASVKQGFNVSQDISILQWLAATIGRKKCRSRQSRGVGGGRGWYGSSGW